MINYLKYQMYRPWVSQIVVRLPIPKAWKRKVVMWQFVGMANLALTRLREIKDVRSAKP